MNEFLRILQSKLDTMKPNFGDDADSVLSFLCGAYYDQNCNSDSEEIKQAFEDLYEAMNGKTLRTDQPIEKVLFKELLKVGIMA